MAKITIASLSASVESLATAVAALIAVQPVQPVQPAQPVMTVKASVKAPSASLLTVQSSLGRALESGRAHCYAKKGDTFRIGGTCRTVIDGQVWHHVIHSTCEGHGR